jgi:hypothetical protein
MRVLIHINMQLIDALRRRPLRWLNAGLKNLVEVLW